jgi:hypothetical protein
VRKTNKRVQTLIQNLKDTLMAASVFLVSTVLRAQASNGIRYLIAGKIGDQGPGAGCDGPVAQIAREGGKRHNYLQRHRPR